MRSETRYRKAPPRPTPRVKTLKRRKAVVKRLPSPASKLASDIATVQRGLELFLFSHLNLAADSQDELAPLGFHRTHHRILYLIAGHPGTSMGNLVRTLRLTPQAVQLPMKQLIQMGYVEQRSANSDRRRKCLFVTSAGGALLARLSKRQHRRIAHAFNVAGPNAVQGFFNVMQSILNEEDRNFLKL